MPHQVRTISRSRLKKQRGKVSDETLAQVIRLVSVLIKAP